jgi:peroxiredoxin family protein
MGASICYCTAAILFILVSQEDKTRQVLDEVRGRVDALRRDSSATSLIDIPNKLLHAKHQLNMQLLNNVKTMIHSNLLPALENSGLGEFSSYVERTILGIENYISATQKYPVINYELKLDGEVTIDDAFDIQVLVANSGSESAYNVEINMVPNEEVTIIREFSKLKVPEIPPNSSKALTWRCIVKSENVIQENKKINLSARLSYTDNRNLQQTLTLSPISFMTISQKEQEQLKMELQVIKDSIPKIKEELLSAAEKNGVKVVAQMMKILTELMDQASGYIDAGAVENAKSWYSLLQLQLELMKEIPRGISDSVPDEEEEEEE